jgi:hypothetical protein
MTSELERIEALERHLAATVEEVQRIRERLDIMAAMDSKFAQVLRDLQQFRFHADQRFDALDLALDVILREVR